MELFQTKHNSFHDPEKIKDITDETEITPGTWVECKDVREYNESYPIFLHHDPDDKRLVILAFNEGKYNSVSIDALDLMVWMRDNVPALWSPEG